MKGICEIRSIRFVKKTGKRTWFEILFDEEKKGCRISWIPGSMEVRRGNVTMNLGYTAQAQLMREYTTAWKEIDAIRAGKLGYRHTTVLSVAGPKVCVAYKPVGHPDPESVMLFQTWSPETDNEGLPVHWEQGFLVEEGKKVESSTVPMYPYQVEDNYLIYDGPGSVFGGNYELYFLGKNGIAK